MMKNTREKNIPVNVSPDEMAEFKVSRKECLLDYRKTVLNNEWLSKKHIHDLKEEDFRPVYVPCALFDVHVGGDVTLSGRMRVDDRDKHYVSWFRTNARLSISYEKVMVSLADGIASGKVRVPRKELVDYSPEKAVPAEVLPAEGTPDTQALKAADTIAADAGDVVLRHMENKYRDICYKRVTPEVLGPLTSAQYAGEALVPAWVASYGSDRQKYDVIVNGNTGDVWIEHRLNPRRFLTSLSVPLVAAALLLAVLASLAGWKPGTWIPVAALALPVILAGTYAYGKKELRRSEPYGVQNTPQNRHITVLEHKCIRSRSYTDADD